MQPAVEVRVELSAESCIIKRCCCRLRPYYKLHIQERLHSCAKILVLINIPKCFKGRMTHYNTKYKSL